MLKKHFKYIAAILAASFVFSGCAYDISKTLPSEATAVEALATQETTTTPEETTTTKKITVKTTTTTTTTETETEPSEETEPEAAPVQTAGTGSNAETTKTPAGGTYTMYSDDYKNFVLNDEYKEFISKCVFVGDSICYGLEAYDILPGEQVVAKGDVAARSIFDYTFKIEAGEDPVPILTALIDLKPEYIVFSMGMNDVNMTSEETFCANYNNLLSQVESFLPDSTLIVLSITPTTLSRITGKYVVRNEFIDQFNIALKKFLDSTDKWIYADVAHEMKNTHNELKANYLGSDDGVHLTPEAYYAILYQLCERMVDGRIYDPATCTYEGEETKEAEVTSGTGKTEKTQKTRKTETPEETTGDETTKKPFVTTTPDTTESEYSGSIIVEDQ